MKEVKLIVDGKEYKLTDEQMELLKLLGASCDTKEKKCKLFDRVCGDEFFSISDVGHVFKYTDSLENCIGNYFLVANYCKDKEIMTKRAKQEVLSRLLWKFSMENGWSDDLWEDKDIPKYYVFYNHEDKVWGIGHTYRQESASRIHFISTEIARQALNEIVIPFQKGRLEVCKLWDK